VGLPICSQRQDEGEDEDDGRKKEWEQLWVPGISPAHKVVTLLEGMQREDMRKSPHRMRFEVLTAASVKDGCILHCCTV
jgi:hypothetical protein